MLEYILDMTKDLLTNSQRLSTREKRLISDEVKYAINQTRVHISYTRKEISDKPSSHLSNVWQRAGENIGSIRNQRVAHLAGIISEKSRYWSSPDLFNESELELSEMKLVQVEALLQNILNDEI